MNTKCYYLSFIAYEVKIKHFQSGRGEFIAIEQWSRLVGNIQFIAIFQHLNFSI